MQLQRHAVVPLRVGHLKQIDLRHCTSDIEERIDLAKAFQRNVDDSLRRLWFPQIDREHHSLRSERANRIRCLFELDWIPRHKHNGRKIPRETNRRGAAGALTRASDNSYRIGPHLLTPP